MEPPLRMGVGTSSPVRLLKDRGDGRAEMSVAIEVCASSYANIRAIHEAILWVDVTRSIGESLDDRESADEDNDIEEGGEGEEGGGEARKGADSKRNTRISAQGRYGKDGVWLDRVMRVRAGGEGEGEGGGGRGQNFTGVNIRSSRLNQKLEQCFFWGGETCLVHVVYLNMAG